MLRNNNINEITTGGQVDNNNKKNKRDPVSLVLSMSCAVFWNYELPITVDRTQYSRKYTNRTEEEAFETLSEFLCRQMKRHIEDDLINTGKRDMLPKLEEVYTKFHIHGQTTHEILYPNDTSNSAHCRGDGKIFICTHC